MFSTNKQQQKAYDYRWRHKIPVQILQIVHVFTIYFFNFIKISNLEIGLPGYVSYSPISE